MSSVDELRSLLKEDSGGTNLYDHLTETIMRILIDKPQNAFDSFELISSDVKKNPLDPEEKGKREAVSEVQLEKQTNWTAKCEALVKVPEEPADDGGVKIQTLFPEDKEALEWAGVSMGTGETYRLFLSVKKLAEGLPGEVEKLRFFGKIFTRTTPYYVLEGLQNEEAEDIDPTKQEGKEGPNKYAYWVSQSIEACEWIKLPNVTMSQIVTARLTKKLLTGSLDAPVAAYPPFDGVEKNLLRAQIARISAATSISPDGYFALSEDEPPVANPAEPEVINEAFPKSSHELKDPEAWKHHEIGLNVQGRVQPMPEVLDDAGEPIVPEEEVSSFHPLQGIESEHWTFRNSPGGAGMGSNSMILARSLRWPGAVALAYGRKFINIYIGNGVVNDSTKRSSERPGQMTYDAYMPRMPKDIDSEWSSDTVVLLEEADTLEDPTPPPPPEEEEE